MTNIHHQHILKIILIRVRPENSFEAQDKKFRPVVRVLDEHVLIFDPNNWTTPRGRGPNKFGLGNRCREQQYLLYYIFYLSLYHATLYAFFLYISSYENIHDIQWIFSISSFIHRVFELVRYAFDRVHDQYATQEEIYETTTKSLIPFVTNGFNATVFAYGATGISSYSRFWILILTLSI